LAELDRIGVDAIISLGDNIGYGPEPDEVVKALVERRVASVLGNHELALHNPAYLKKLNFTSRESLEITRDLLSPDSLEFCRDLPAKIVMHDARFVHGSPPDSVTSYIWDASTAKLTRLFDTFPEKLCCYGHTHDLARFVGRDHGYVREVVEMEIIPLMDDFRYLINPGSVGQPRDSIDNRSKYGIWDIEAGTFENRAVSYDVETTVALLRERGFPEFNATRLLAG